MDTNKLWALIGDGRLWIICGVGFGLGALGGFIHAIGSEPPVDLKQWWKRVLVGAVAAVAVLCVSEPDNAIQFIGGSLVAGFAGQALLTALEARVRLEGAEQRVVETRRALQSKAEEVIETKDALHAKAEEARAASRERDTAMEAARMVIDAPGPAPAEPPVAAMARLEAARGMLNAIRPRGGVA